MEILKLQVRNEEGEVLNERQVSREDLEVMQTALDKLYDDVVSNDKAKTVDEFDALIDNIE